MRNSLFALLVTVCGLAGAAPMRVVTTVTDLAWVARELGGKDVEVKALLTGKENPHYLDASPSFIREVGSAQVVCFAGLDLEVGWLPKVLSRSGNASVQAGGRGHCDAGSRVSVLEKPTGPVDRSLGDVHPSGNPHFWLSPLALAQSARAIADSLIAANPPAASAVEASLKALEARLVELHQRNRERIQRALAGETRPLIVEYHKEFSYLLDAYGLKSFGSIEEKPGVPPSAGRLASVAQAAKGAGVRLVIAAPYSPKQQLERFKEISGIPVLFLPTALESEGKLSDYEAMQNFLVDSLLGALGQRHG